MVSALDSGSGGPGPGHGVVFLGKTLYSHSASLHPGVSKGTASCYRNRDKLRPDGPLGS